MKWQGFRWWEYMLYCLITSSFFFLGVIVAISGALSFALHALFFPLRSKRNAVSFVTLWLMIAGVWMWWAYATPINLDNQVVAVTVDPNDNFGRFTAQLDEAGALTSPTFFKFLAKVRGVDRRLWVGRYEFTGTVSLKSILEDIESGRIATISVTIPEGLSAPETAGIVARSLRLDSAEFVDLCFDSARSQTRYALTDCEGYLFPETYRFTPGVTAAEALDKMVYTALAELNTLALAAPDRTMGLSEIVTLASIIEAEARYGDEREIIASVYRNRLARGMRLQADPTVGFALGVRRPLVYHDLRVSHPYNTYRHYGLPPGPINSPGRGSLMAALYPAKTDYLFFVADMTGRHVFSQTNDAHNRARASIRAAREKAGDDTTVVGADDGDSTIVDTTQS